MKGFQLQEYDIIGGMTRTGTHPKVYKTRWGARLALFFSLDWMFEQFRVVPTAEPVEPAANETVIPVDPLDHRQWPVVPKHPMARTFTGRTLNTGQWKCNECGLVNEWHAPTCRCVRNRR